MSLTRHLHDDRLYDCYLANTSGEALDPRAAEHLADCEVCAVRYREFTGFLGAVAAEGEAEADDLFTPERLHHQQEAILRRIEQAGRPARVISFPGHPATVAAAGAGRIAPRWLAAAAAAGLFVGVAVGGAFMPSRGGQPAASPRAVAQAVVPYVQPALTVSTAAPATEAMDDDRFLRDLEVALQRPHTRELLSFDNLTPHAREITTRVR